MGARGNGRADTDAAAQSPPVVELGLDDRLGRCNRRVEARVASKAVRRANGSLAQAIAHSDRRGGILALVFAHLPLPREEPQRIEDGSVKSFLKIAIARLGLQSVIMVGLHGSLPPGAVDDIDAGQRRR